jgi:hypothetical protein
MQPLEQIGMLNPSVAASLKDYRQAQAAQQTTWIESYSAALKTARVEQGQVDLPPGQYGPVAPLMEAMLNLARSGLLDGALTEDANPSSKPNSANGKPSERIQPRLGHSNPVSQPKGAVHPPNLDVPVISRNLRY